jgi:hypothetical protein
MPAADEGSHLVNLHTLVGAGTIWFRVFGDAVGKIELVGDLGPMQPARASWWGKPEPRQGACPMIYRLPTK